MQVSELVQNGGMLHMKLTIPGNLYSYTSPEYVLCGVVQFQAKSCYAKSSSLYHHTIMITLKKLFQSNHLDYAIKFSSMALNKTETFLCSGGSNCWVVYDGNASGNVFKPEVDIDLSLDISSSNTVLFASLNDDTQLMDLELCGEDGSVKVHKTILAGMSPFIKTLFENSGQWDEATSNSVNVPATQETLQQLKDYMYLQKMPDTGVEQLIALASYFLMTDLAERCSVKLLTTLSAENAAEYLELAMKYKLKVLLLAILESVKRNVIKNEDIDRVSSFGNKRQKIDS